MWCEGACCFSYFYLLELFRIDTPKAYLHYSFFNLQYSLASWSRRADLNRWPADYESAALPTELRRHQVDRKLCFLEAIPKRFNLSGVGYAGSDSPDDVQIETF